MEVYSTFQIEEVLSMLLEKRRSSHEDETRGEWGVHCESLVVF